MARDWSRDRRRQQTVAARRAEVNDLVMLETPRTEPDKAAMRAETERLVAQYPGKVRRLPMYAALRCRSCGHRGTAKVPTDAEPRFKCSDCGSSLVAWHV
jgi:hypothetical protein